MTDTVFERNRPAGSLIDATLSGVRDDCFWIEDAPGPAFDSLTRDHNADLVVVGGGYTGLWTAVRAKQRDPGRRVVLLESRRLGWAASGRNGGFCAASPHPRRGNGRSRWPDEYDELEQLGAANLDEIEQTVQSYGIDCGFERTGDAGVATRAAPGRVAAVEAASAGGRSSTRTRCAPRSTRRPTSAGSATPDELRARGPRAAGAGAAARRRAGLGVGIAEDTPPSASADRSRPARRR